MPKLRNQLRLTWSSPWDLSLSLLWRHVDDVQGRNEFHDSIDARDYFDIAGLWEITQRMRLRAGINNLFDEEPPIVANVAPGTGNTFASLYDPLGQYWFLGLQVGF